MNTIKFATSKPTDAPQGPMCRLDAKPLSLGKTTAAGTGAMTSAFMGFLI